MRLLCAVFILIISPSSFGVSLGEQLVDLGYEPKSCQRSEPSEYRANDSTVHITFVNDLSVPIKPAWLDLSGQVQLRKQRAPGDAWNDRTLADTVWVWIDEQNKRCIGTTRIAHVDIQPKTFYLSELDDQQLSKIDAGTRGSRERRGIDVPSRTDSTQTKPKNKDRAILSTFFSESAGPIWLKSDNWLSDAPVCDWYGITCDEKTKRVTEIRLRSNGLTGELPPVIGELNALKKLDLFGNKLHGNVPAELGNLKGLTHLDLGWNKFSGVLPRSFNRLTKLRLFKVNDNLLEGQPPSFLRIAPVYNIDLSDNKFVGALDFLPKNNRVLAYFRAHNNKLGGSIPDDIAEAVNLRIFDISGNLFAGRISRPIAERLAAVPDVNLSRNDFKCPVPFVLGDIFAENKEFCVGFTKRDDFDGEMEANYAKPENPENPRAFKSFFRDGRREGTHKRWYPDGQIMIEASYSKGVKDGRYRKWFVDGKQTREMNYKNGQLHGPYFTFKKGEVDKQYCYRNGKRVSISDCELTFNDPSSKEDHLEKEREALVDLYTFTHGREWKENKGWLSDSDHCGWFGVTCEDQRVTRLELPGNRLRGSLPDQLANLHRLKWLGLEQNELTGEFPKAIRRLVNLEVMSLRKNKFSGEIPEWLGELSRLRWLSIAANQFSGKLPDSVGDLSRLRLLYASNNNFQGGLPLWADKIENLSLAHNQLSGAISESLAVRLLDSHQYQYSFNGNNFSCPWPAKIADIFAQNGEFCVEGQISDSYTGELSANYDTGRTAYRGNFVDGKRSGRYQRWYENGGLRTETYYNRGKRDGLSSHYGEDGTLKSDTPYANDRKHGFQVVYKSDGRISSKECFIRGKKSGSEECESLKIASAPQSDSRPERSPDSEASTTVTYTSEKNPVYEPTPAPVRAPIENRKAPNSAERLALIVHELNSAKRTYNDQYALSQVRMDYNNRELNYLFSVRGSVNALDSSILAMAARSAYCSSPKLELFREENITAVWIYSDSFQKTISIRAAIGDCG